MQNPTALNMCTHTKTWWADKSQTKNKMPSWDNWQTCKQITRHGRTTQIRDYTNELMNSGEMLCPSLVDLLFSFISAENINYWHSLGRESLVWWCVGGLVGTTAVHTSQSHTGKCRHKSDTCSWGTPSGGQRWENSVMFFFTHAVA